MSNLLSLAHPRRNRQPDDVRDRRFAQADDHHLRPALPPTAVRHNHPRRTEVIAKLILAEKIVTLR